MQPQFILTSVLVGLAAAMPQAVDNEDGPKLYCKDGEGSVIRSSRGPVCIGVKGEDFGPAKQCPMAICLRAGFCEPIEDENGCMVCPPGCGVGGNAVEEDVQAADESSDDCPPAVCSRIPGCEHITAANGCQVCPPGCALGGKPIEEDAEADDEPKDGCPIAACDKFPGCEPIMGANGCKVCPTGC